MKVFSLVPPKLCTIPHILVSFSYNKVISGQVYVAMKNSFEKESSWTTFIFKTKKNTHFYLLNKATPAIKVFFFFAEKSLGGK